jgi:hypothetical protein
MTETVRTVRTGSVGLDLALAGGMRFVRRSHDGRGESAIVLIRGGPGTGKSVLAQDLALRLAREAAGDVLYYCVEVLPSEVLAQRAGFEGFDPRAVVDLSREGHRSAEITGPGLALGMRDVPTDEDGVPDVGGGLLDLVRIAATRGFEPRVVVVDCLSDGYELAQLAPRPTVDGLCKLAIEQGWVLILVEECTDDTPSPWAFAVDTVLWLRLAPVPSPAQWRRELVVTKNRFGGCEPGPHRLLIQSDRVRVVPPFAAYRNAARDLVLPEPATNRSLAVPGVPEHKRELFAIPDGQGCCLVVHAPEVRQDILYTLTGEIGRSPAHGSRGTVAFASFLLVERDNTPLDLDEDGLSRKALDPFVDGEEWLEMVFHDLATFRALHRAPICRVRVGPTDSVGLYQDVAGLSRAVSLFVRLIIARGMVVVLFGHHPEPSVLRAAVLSSLWTVNEKPDTSVDVLQVTAFEVYRGAEQIKFEVELRALQESEHPGL